MRPILGDRQRGRGGSTGQLAHMPVVPTGLAPNAPMGSVATWHPRTRDLRDVVRFGVSPIGT